MIAHLRVEGAPVPQGSVRIGWDKGRPVIRQGGSDDHEARLDAYRDRVTIAGHDWLADHEDWPHYWAPVAWGAVYRIARATTDRAGDRWHAKSRPGDRTKLDRATEDALTEVLYHDDAQIAWGCSTKVLAARGQPSSSDVWVTSADDWPTIAGLVAADIPAGMPPPISSAGTANAGRADRIGSVKPSISSASALPSGSPFSCLRQLAPDVGRVPAGGWL